MIDGHCEEGTEFTTYAGTEAARRRIAAVVFDAHGSMVVTPTGTAER